MRHPHPLSLLRNPLWLSGAAALVALGLGSSGCERDGCLGGDENCVVPAACQQLSYQCADRAVEIFVISEASQIPGGPDAHGAIGDVMLRNSQVVAIIEGVDNANFFGETGGALKDLATRSGENDQLAYSLVTTGLLPGDQPVYTSMRILPDAAGVRAVQFDGHLSGNPGHRLYTRFEIRPCEPGIRVRTELVNNGEEPVVWSLSDGFFWSQRSINPFSPVPEGGFEHPQFTLGTVNDVIKPTPFVTAAAYNQPGVGYAVVACNQQELEGFQHDWVSLIGRPRRIVPPRDYEVYERFIGAAGGLGGAGPTEVALEVRSQLFSEPYIRVTGSVVLGGGRAEALGDITRAEVHFFQTRDENDEAVRIPWTTAVPDSVGAFTAYLPASREFEAEVHAYGKVVETRTFSVGEDNADIGEMRIPAVGTFQLSVTLDGTATEAQVFLEPADGTTRADVEALFRGHELGNVMCAPLLGPPYGGSPACNRVLVNQTATFDAPPGTYDLYATRGPFATMARTRVTLNGGGTSEVNFALTSLPILDDIGALSADFHVHGQKSYDTNMPDHSRVLSYLAAGVDVIAATDHEFIWNYAQAMGDLPTLNRIQLLVGLETPSLAIFNFRPDVTFPQTVGHYNFWPLNYQAGAPRGGAAYAERAEPGLIFTRMSSSGLTNDGVIQMNHPMSPGAFGREFGLPYALGLNLTEPLPLFDDGSGPAVIIRRPAGAEVNNHDYHVQEVMNGTDNGRWVAHRAYWFYLLNQGIIRGGTANSDSHTLVDNVVGTPRTLVFTDNQVNELFNVATFNASVRNGRMIGTNGPVVLTSVTGSDAIVHSPSTTPFPATNDDDLEIRVVAAPWVPVEEVRIYVNGLLAAFIRDGINKPADPLGTADTVRFEGELRLGDILPPDITDAWIVVEAGAALPTIGDVDCDGVPDTTDNNNDTRVDWRDVDRNGDGVVDGADLDVDQDGSIGPQDDLAPCESDLTGPLIGPPTPDPADDAYLFNAVTPGGFSLGFTNPLLIDRNGQPGFQAPGLPPL